MNELMNQFLNPSGREDWSTCQFCGAKVKSKNLDEHMTKVHPRAGHGFKVID